MTIQKNSAAHRAPTCANKKGSNAKGTVERIWLEDDPRKRRECRWRQGSGALSGLAREIPHLTDSYVRRKLDVGTSKVNVDKFNTVKIRGRVPNGCGKA
jgi:hypothetical protein